MERTFVNFQEIKENVSIVRVLALYGVELRHVYGSTHRGKCPLPTHTSKSSSYSFSVDIEKNVWACHSASCCRARHDRRGGDVLNFVALMESCSAREAAIKLSQWFALLAGGSTARKVAKVEPEAKEG